MVESSTYEMRMIFNVKNSALKTIFFFQIDF